MASQMDVHVVSCNVGALSNAKRAFMFVPDKGGGITVLSAAANLSAVGTSSINLIDLGTAGTSSAGTIFTKGSTVWAVNTPQAFTVSTAFVQPGHYIGVEELNVGACAAETIITIAYVTGIAGG